jgi:hypothetical protein
VRAKNSSGLFCSRFCYEEFLGAGSKTTSRGRGWALARKEALRENPFCALCGTMEKLHVHHIIPFRISRDNSQKNLIPLCRSHHKRVEMLYLKSDRVLSSIPIEERLFYRRLDLIERQTITRFRILKLIGDLNAQAA